MARQLDPIRSYHEAEELFSDKCNNNKEDRVKLGYETYLMNDGSDYYILAHATRIITWKPNGDVIVFTGGWRTQFTANRIRPYIPAGYTLRVKNFEWFIEDETGKNYLVGRDALLPAKISDN